MARSRVEVKLTGQKALSRNLLRLAREFPKDVRRSLNFRSEIIMTTSKRDYVPVDKGPLMNSGHVVMDDIKLKATLGFGGPAGIGNVGKTNSEYVGYAITQHEDTELNHPGKGEAEYLKKPLRAALRTLAKDIASDVML